METASPKVFISYSWDNDSLKTWVSEFATSLRQDGIDVSLDQWKLEPGGPLPEFMEKEIRENDYVLIICTPRYKERSDTREGGVGYEGDIMTAEKLTKGNNSKFIPILRVGEWLESAPSWVSGKYYIDLREHSPQYVQNYTTLLKTIQNCLPKAPKIGRSHNETSRMPELMDKSYKNYFDLGVFFSRLNYALLEEKEFIGAEYVNFCNVLKKIGLPIISIEQLDNIKDYFNETDENDKAKKYSLFRIGHCSFLLFLLGEIGHKEAEEEVITKVTKLGLDTEIFYKYFYQLKSSKDYMSRNKAFKNLLKEYYESVENKANQKKETEKEQDSNNLKFLENLGSDED